MSQCERCDQLRLALQESQQSENLLAQTCQNNLACIREQGEKLRAQRTVIQELAEVLQKVLNMWVDDESQTGKQGRSALQAATPWLRKEGDVK